MLEPFSDKNNGAYVVAVVVVVVVVVSTVSLDNSQISSK